MEYKRSERVSELIHKEICDILLADLKDPGIGFVTITKVRMNPDLKLARVFFSLIGEEKEIEKAQNGLDRASGYVKKLLGRRLRLKHIPTVVFKYDRSLEYADHIDTILKELKEKEGV